MSQYSRNEEVISRANKEYSEAPPDDLVECDGCGELFVPPKFPRLRYGEKKYCRNCSREDEYDGRE